MGQRPGKGLDRQVGRLTVVLEKAPVIMFGLDKDGLFTFSEGNGLVAMGLRDGQSIGTSILDLYSENNAAMEAIRGALAGRHTSFGPSSVARTSSPGSLPCSTLPAWFKKWSGFRWTSAIR